MYSNKLYISVYWFFHKNVFSKQYSIVVIVVDFFALYFHLNIAVLFCCGSCYYIYTKITFLIILAKLVN